MSSHQQRIEKISDKLKNWDYQLDRLEHRLIDLSDDARQRANETLTTLKEQRQQLASRLEESRNSAGEMLDELKQSMDKAADDLKQGLGKLRSQFGLKDDDSEE
ncbi:MAG: hypothetical protein R3292_14005 [Alcanivorax sp.]|nr:hypothetical protein [Alcanivorax sp.]